MDMNNAKLNYKDEDDLQNTQDYSVNDHERPSNNREQKIEKTSSNYRSKQNRASSQHQHNRSMSRSRSRSPTKTKATKRGRTPNPFINFVQDFRQDYVGYKSSDIAQKAAKKWKGMSSVEKQPYIDKANSVKQQKQQGNSTNSKSNQSKTKTVPRKTDSQQRENKNYEKKKRKTSDTESDTESVTSGTASTVMSDDNSD